MFIDLQAAISKNFFVCAGFSHFYGFHGLIEILKGFPSHLSGQWKCLDVSNGTSNLLIQKRPRLYTFPEIVVVISR